MSLRLGMILSNDCTESELDYFRNKYKIALSNKENKQFKTSQLMQDEILIEPTGLYDDSETGIGSFELYSKDLSDLRNQFKLDDGSYHFMISEFEKRRIQYREDAYKWLQILTEMRINYGINKVGLFYFGGYTTTEEMDFPIYKRTFLHLGEIDEFDLMKISEDEIGFFI